MMRVVSFFAPRPDHPFFQDYQPFLNLLRLSCERFGHQHLVLTDDPSVGDDAYVTELPRSLMKATIAAQLAYLDDPQFANVPTLFTGADCVLARDPAQIDTRGVDLVITVDDRFQDCRMNCGAMFIPRPKSVRWVWREALKRCGDDWGDDQISLYSVIDEMRANWLHVREIPCDPHNLAPDHPADDCRRGTVLHFRGARKDWMEAYCQYWLGLGSGVTPKITANMSPEAALANVRINAARDLPWVPQMPKHDGHAVLVGGGPSVADCVDEIRWRQENGQTIFAMNGAGRFLLNVGITPDYGVMLDGRSKNAEFLCETKRGWLLASRCHPVVFDQAGAAAVVWHFAEENDEALMRAALSDASTPLVIGGIVVGLTAMSLVFMMGFRQLHLYGYDSSDRDGESHPWQQGETSPEMRRLEVWCDGQKFSCGYAMYAQAQAFGPWATTLAEHGATITVHGDGLLPTIARAMQRADTAAEGKAA